MADRPNKKRPRKEKEQDFPSEAPTNLHNENQPPQPEDSSPVTRIHPLRLRAMGKNTKLPHIYRDYHVHTFGSVNMGTIDFIVPGDDIILLVHSQEKLAFFRRHGDQISAARDDHGRPIAGRAEGSIKSVCYNNHDSSFLIEYEPFEPEIWGLEIQIISLKIASIHAGQSPTSRLVFPGESSIIKWGFDIPFCRAMIHNYKDKKFKFCELKEYRLLFTIPDFGFIEVAAHSMLERPCFKSLSPGNMDMLTYDRVSSSFNGGSGIQLRIYSKLNGTLQKQMFPHELSIVPQMEMEFIALCGSDTLLMQGYLSEIEVVKMSSENPVSIIDRRNTKIRAVCDQ